MALEVPVALAGAILMRVSAGAPPAPEMKTGFTGLVYADIYLEHDPGPHHPECPERLRAIIRALERSGLLGRLVRLEPASAAVAQLALVHEGSYIERIRTACASAPLSLDADTAVSERSFDAALAASGGVMAAVDAVIAGRIRNAFCAVRPPGHHATRARAMGFCLFNNVAVAARYVQERHGVKKVLIVDWDAHHGNGTQEAFYKDGSVLYFSTHQFPCYPGSGSAAERGAGAGKGTTVNVPMAPRSGKAEFLRAFRDVLVPAADRFGPDFVLVSAGFDAHGRDPLTNLDLAAETFGKLTEIVKGIAEKHCAGRLVSVLEGGYHLESLGASVVEHVRALMEEE